MRFCTKQQLNFIQNNNNNRNNCFFIALNSYRCIVVYFQPLKLYSASWLRSRLINIVIRAAAAPPSQIGLTLDYLLHTWIHWVHIKWIQHCRKPMYLRWRNRNPLIWIQSQRLRTMMRYVCYHFILTIRTIYHHRQWWK